MKSMLASAINYFYSKSMDIVCGLAIIFTGYALYNPALRFVPTDFDDLVLLSAVKNVSNPFMFFVQDWGFGNYGYRPLHSISLWLGYQLFGVSSGPNQLINLVLHIFIILLLYALLSRLQSNRILAFLFSLLGLISLYTLSPATWISDRPTLFVAIFLLIALNYLVRQEKTKHPNILLLAGLSILALMSKESGLLVPLVVIGILFFQFEKSSQRKKLIFVLVFIMLAYILFRFMIFGSQAGSYDVSGYLFGFRYYENSSALSGLDFFISKIENVIKNTVAIFVPLFDGQGKISLIGTLPNSFILISTTLVLVGLAFSRKLSAYQKIGLAIIILNALVHVQVFRYRTLYLGQIGLVLFLAASPAFSDKHKFRSTIASLAAALLVFWSMQIIGENLTYQYLARLDLLRGSSFESEILASSSRIDADIVRQIITKYRH
jgi:4-amino-4-deoxy-L-arabinose transferase-like glycosyltransferase